MQRTCGSGVEACTRFLSFSVHPWHANRHVQAQHQACPNVPRPVNALPISLVRQLLDWQFELLTNNCFCWLVMFSARAAEYDPAGTAARCG
jgi:hypothetical protein